LLSGCADSGLLAAGRRLTRTTTARIATMPAATVRRRRQPHFERAPTDLRAQQCLYFLPLPQGQAAFRAGAWDDAAIF